MRTTEILPEVSVIDAILLFRRLGTDVTGMTPEELRETRRRLINRHHPDRGGSLDMAQAINAAFDLLKDGVPKYRGLRSRLVPPCASEPARPAGRSEAVQSRISGMG